MALKVLHPRFRDDHGYRRRFRNEARSAARLHHSNIVPVFDFGEHDGIFYYAMQFIPGVGLDRVLEDVRRLREAILGPGPSADSDRVAAPPIATGLHTGYYPAAHDSPTADAPETIEVRVGDPLELTDATPAENSSRWSVDRGCYYREVVRIGAEVAEALAHAHERGVLHRDVKPSNLLLDGRGTAWVADFGLAKLDGGEDLTETGDVVGTLRYMAPERFEGHSDARCDIYSLGVTLYEMIALRPAFGGANRAQVMRRSCKARLRPLRDEDPRVSRDLESVVLKAMARSPSDRYSSAAELAAELRLVEANRPIRSRRISAPEQYWRWCKRNPTFAAMTALAVALTLVVAVVFTTAVVWLRRSNREIRGHLDRAQSAERGRSEQLWAADLAQARAWRSSRKPGQRFEALGAIRRASALGRELGFPPSRYQDLRDEAIAALALPDMHAGDPVPVADIGELNDVDLERRIYCGTDRNGGAWIRRLDDHSLVAALPEVPSRLGLGFARHGYLVDGSAKDGVRPVPTLGPCEPRRGSSLGGPQPGPLVGRCARRTRLVVSLKGGDLTVYDLPSGRLAASLKPGLSRLDVVPKLHPFAPFVAITSPTTEPVFEIRHVATGRSATFPLPWTTGGPFNSCWSADGRKLAVTRALGRVIALFDVDVTTEPPRARPFRTIESDLLDTELDVTFNPEEDRLYAGMGWSRIMLMCDVNSGQILFQTPLLLNPFVSALRHESPGRIVPGMVDVESSTYRPWSVAEGRECRLFVPRLPFDLVREDRGQPGLAIPRRRRDDRRSHGIRPRRRPRDRPGPDPRQQLAALPRVRRGRPPGHEQRRWVLSMGGPPRHDHPGGAGPRPSRTTPLLRRLRGDRLQPRREDGRPGNDQGSCRRPGFPRRRGGETTLPREGNGREHFAISPDGRWVGLGTENDGSRIYDARTGELAWAAPRAGSAGRLAFLPDGRWVAHGLETTRLYAIGSWTPGPSLGPGAPLDCTADGRIILTLLPNRGLRLADAATGRTLGLLQDPVPEDTSPGYATFVPDGSGIVLQHRLGARVWDIRRIRIELCAPRARLGNPQSAAAFVRRPGAGRVHRRHPLAARGPGCHRSPHRAPRPVRRAEAGRRGPSGPRAVARAARARRAAIRHLGRALQLEPGLAEAAFERGLLRYQRGDRPGAIADFGRAIADERSKSSLTSAAGGRGTSRGSTRRPRPTSRPPSTGTRASLR